jgi:hypothetical protein
MLLIRLNSESQYWRAEEEISNKSESLDSSMLPWDGLSRKNAVGYKVVPNKAQYTNLFSRVGERKINKRMRSDYQYYDI